MYVLEDAADDKNKPTVDELWCRSKLQKAKACIRVLKGLKEVVGAFLLDVLDEPCENEELRQARRHHRTPSDAG